MYSKIKKFCDQHTLIHPGSTIIIGLSGGPDSVFLVHFLKSIQKEYSLTLIAAHLNHGWRAESDHDEAFCKSLAASLGIPFVSAQAHDIVVTRKHTGSQEDLGRQLRRQFFKRVADSYAEATNGRHVIALAHHQDDLVETFFIRLLRGAGITGLASIRAEQDKYIRPLLCVTKKEILEYLEAQSLAYCIDVTNEHEVYLRNKIRKYIIPATVQCDARAPKTMVNTIAQLQEVDDFLEAVTQKTYAMITHDNLLSIPQLLELHPYMQKRIILAWLRAHSVPFTPTNSFFNELVRFLSAGTAPQHTIADWIIIKQRTFARIKKNN